MLTFFFAAVAFLLLIAAGAAGWKTYQLTKKYAPIESVKAETEKAKAELQAMTEKARKEVEVIKYETEKVRGIYQEKRSFLDELEKQLLVAEDKMGFVEAGHYEPHFDYEDSEQFKEEIRRTRQLQKHFIKEENAVTCQQEWSVGKSKTKGRAMIKRQIRLTLRAFNNECDAAIAKVSWDNVSRMEDRIERSKTAINKLNASLEIAINEEYCELKKRELFLTHEHREKCKQEKEKRAQLVMAEREEKKVQQEAIKAQREEENYQAMLEKAKQELEESGSEDWRKKCEELEAKLAEAHKKAERSKSLAELTKCGYIYVISNVGSFGEDVMKIGLTRRASPKDRIAELGDASVPFKFDTHAMIFSKEAPALEKALHEEFAERRVNTSNLRKEFFKVSLDEVEAAIKRLEPEADFHRELEAQEWRETLARRNQRLNAQQPAENSLPKSI